MHANKELTAGESGTLKNILKNRFEKNMHRHSGMKWDKIVLKLEQPQAAQKLRALYEMERTGGEPDIIEYQMPTGEYVFFDCAKESPAGRRSLCYDHKAQQSRKAHQPKNNTLDFAATIGIELLTEAQYRHLQLFGNFDTKTSSWIKTPPDIRKLGGALFADFRYGHVFVYHNGAQSYYSSRGFRGALIL